MRFATPRALALLLALFALAAEPAAASSGRGGYDWGAAALGVGGGLGAFILGSVVLALSSRRKVSGVLTTRRDDSAGI